MIKTFLCTVVLAMGWQQAWGYALLGPSLGPDAAWQTVSLGYNLSAALDVGAPKNIGQGYRRNSPFVYYGYDQNFLDYFGSNGMAAVDSAFAVMNALTNADNLQLSRFPLYSEQSSVASALELSDLKSFTLGELIEQMGLTAPVRYVWTVRERYTPAGANCSTNPALNGLEYGIAQRNYDPLSQVYSSYVNGTLYDYELWESCGTFGNFPYVVNGITVDTLTVPFPVDTEDDNLEGDYTPLSEATDPWPWLEGFGGFGYGALQDGMYYTTLTEDDAGGLRYLYSTNNVNVETPTPGSQLEVTNFNLTLLETSDLAPLLQFAQTNPPAAVQAAFPNLVISSSSDYITLGSNPVVVSFFQEENGATWPTPPQLVVETNTWTFFAVTNYTYIFGNLVIVHSNANTVAQYQTISLAQLNGAPSGTPPVTNVTYQTAILTNVVSGDYFLIPPGSCGVDRVVTLLTNNFVSAFTNVIATATITSGPGAGFVGTKSIVTYFTNDWYEVYGCSFQTPTPNLYQGIGKIQFVKADYDSLTGQFFNPVTNVYSMILVTNSQPVVQYFQRIITQPDILMDAVDLASPAGNAILPEEAFPPFARAMTFTEDPEPAGAAAQSGPGTISSYPTTISFNDAGNYYLVAGSEVNGANAFLSQSASLFQWASYDGSTNAPIVYPDSTSIQNLENEFLIKITPPILPDATNGVPYSETFTTTGGGAFTPPYTWSLGIDPIKLTQTALPAGLTLSSGGTISGTPVNDATGTYDFLIQMTDYNGRSVTWNYFINIDP